MKPKPYCDSIHLEFYDKQEMDVYLEDLRKMLIKDCHKIFEDRGQTISGYTFEEIINKHFKVE